MPTVTQKQMSLYLVYLFFLSYKGQVALYDNMVQFKIRFKIIILQPNAEVKSECKWHIKKWPKGSWQLSGGCN